MKHEIPPVESADVAVIGGGPAGLMAAIAAAEAGARVILAEQLSRPGVKLLATGGGRCNLTNTLPADDFMARCGRQGRFMHPALGAMDSGGLRTFLDALGVPTHAPDGFHVYPVSDSARTVQQALVGRALTLGVAVRLGLCVTGLWLEEREAGSVSEKPKKGAAASSKKRGKASSEILSQKCGTPALGRANDEKHSRGVAAATATYKTPDFVLRGVETSGGPLAAPRVILASGGRSYPDLGATGTGYELARQAGHTVTDLVPALVSLETREAWPARCAGVSLSPARAWIDLPRQPRAGVTGDILFTHRGISGPAVLDLSGDVSVLLVGGEVPLRIDLVPGTSEEEWVSRFDHWQVRGGATTFVTLLDHYLPRSLATVLCGLAGITPAIRPSQVARPARQALAELLTALPLTGTATEGWAASMVTRGGVTLREVDARTLAGRLLPGLAFAGEILDLDGPSGGFNLQWAFSSGHLAGAHAAGL
jgi:hypothetical protein